MFGVRLPILGLKPRCDGKLGCQRLLGEGSPKGGKGPGS